MTLDDIIEKDSEGHYKTKIPYAKGKYEAWEKDQGRLEEIFRNDAIEAAGLTGHPKADKLFHYAWREGHASGRCDVAIILCEIAELMLED
jgi:hypothetical protein